MIYKKIIAIGVLACLLLVSCTNTDKLPSISAPTAPIPLNSAHMANGTLTVVISAPSAANGKPISLKLFEQNVNMYDPSVEPLAKYDAVLDENSHLSTVLLEEALAGHVYQLFGLINKSGSSNDVPENGDYYVSFVTQPIDGDQSIIIGKNLFERYTTIVGAGCAERSTGTHHVRIWESKEDEMESTIGWIYDADNVLFRFDGAHGVIGRVGKKYQGLRVDDIDNSLTNADALITFFGSGSYYFGIYGWVFNNTGWGNSDIKHEFYVVEHMIRDRETDPKIGSITVDGIVYDMHRHTFSGGGGYRFKAIRMSDQRLSGPINLKPFFEYWRNNGMENLLVNELTWHIEVLGSGQHNGDVYFWNVEVPDYDNSSRIDY